MDLKESDVSLKDSSLPLSVLPCVPSLCPGHLKGSDLLRNGLVEESGITREGSVEESTQDWEAKVETQGLQTQRGPKQGNGKGFERGMPLRVTVKLTEKEPGAMASARSHSCSAG